LEHKSFYSQISENKWKSYALFGAVLALVFILGFFFAYLMDAGPLGMFAVAAFAIVYSLGGYYYSDKIVLAATGARPVRKEEYPHLFHTAEGLAIAAGIPAPKLYIIDDASPNAFATGRDPKNSVIAVTSGLVALMDRQEIEGVLAHEMSHIQNYDIRFATLVVVLIGMIGIMSNIFMRYFFWFGGGRGGGERKGGGGAFILIIGILFMVLAPIAAQLVRLAISRKREFLADASAAKLTRNPDGLASALEKLGKNKQPLKSASDSTAPLFIVNPFAGKLAGLFSTHPPIEERVKALRAM